MNNSGGMFSKLLDPNTAKPKAVVMPVTNPVAQEEKPNTATPLPPQKKIAKEVVKKEKKRKVGVYFTKSERQNLDDVEYKLNRGERIIGQSEILALGVET